MEFTKYGITETPKLIYNNPLASKSDIDGFVLEGTANISFPEGKLRMENGLSAAQGQKANYVLWCPNGFSIQCLHWMGVSAIKGARTCNPFLCCKGKKWRRSLWWITSAKNRRVSALSSRRYKCLPCIIFQKKRARWEKLPHMQLKKELWILSCCAGRWSYSGRCRCIRTVQAWSFKNMRIRYASLSMT